MPSWLKCGTAMLREQPARVVCNLCCATAIRQFMLRDHHFSVLALRRSSNTREVMLRVAIFCSDGIPLSRVDLKMREKVMC